MRKLKIIKKIKKWLRIIFIMPFAVISFSVGLIIFKISYVFLITTNMVKAFGTLLMLEPYSARKNFKEAFIECKTMFSKYI